MKKLETLNEHLFIQMISVCDKIETKLITYITHQPQTKLV